ncbi:MAG: hypothetical protein HY097_06765, partial [Nitrospinae bacterium]|nr:hypothetical protein [Nitrospinota bacterium]
MKLNFRTYEKISYRGFFRLLENRREAFELYATDLKRCLENPQAEYPFLGELDLALEDDYEITSRDVSVK